MRQQKSVKNQNKANKGVLKLKNAKKKILVLLSSDFRYKHFNFGQNSFEMKVV